MVLTFNDFSPSSAREISTEAVIIDSLAKMNKQDLMILDIGCGRGHFADKLAGLGYTSFGLEPQARVNMRHTTNGAEIHKGGAQDLPFDTSSFDIVMFGHSLHHVPKVLMDKASGEALRILKPAGKLIVTEPLAEGNFYEVMQPVDDEAPLYEIVKDKLQKLVLSQQVTHKCRSYVFGEPSYKTVGHLKSILVKVDPDRAKAPTEAWEEFNRRFIAQPKNWFFGKRTLRHYSRIDFFQKS